MTTPLPPGGTRSITFAGPLAYGDCFRDDGKDPDLIGIDRKPHDPRAAFLSSVSGFASEKFIAEATERMAASWVPYPAAYRTARPARRVRVPALAFAAGPIEDIPGTALFAAEVEGFEPGHDLEAWLLPVTSPTLEFLVTPAGPMEDPVPDPLPPVQPGIRRVDPDAEAARLAEARKDPPGREWGILHPGGKVTVRADGHGFQSRAAADLDRPACDADCGTCDGGPHVLVWRAVLGWQAE